MKNLVVGAGVALAAVSTSAHAADLDRELGLIVSGVVDQWVGVQIIDGPAVAAGPAGFTTDSETLFANGGEGLLSLPLGENLSIQSDVKYEYNSNAMSDSFDVIGPRYSYQGAVHLSWRDPSSGLFGIFGGAGTSDMSSFDTDAHFVGGEAQLYMGDMTFYAQGGYVDFSADSVIFGPAVLAGLDDGFFARGVFR